MRKYFEAERPRGAEERGGENTWASGFRARTDGQRSRKQAGNGHRSRSSSKWKFQMIASESHLRVDEHYSGSVRYFCFRAVETIAPTWARRQMTGPSPLVTLTDSGTGWWPKVKSLRHGICEFRPCRYCRFTAQTLRQSGPYRCGDKLRLYPDLEPDRLTAKARGPA